MSGRSIPSQWNEERAKVKKKPIQEKNQEEEFPSLESTPQQKKKNKII